MPPESTLPHQPCAAGRLDDDRRQGEEESAFTVIRAAKTRSAGNRLRAPKNMKLAMPMPVPNTIVALMICSVLTRKYHSMEHRYNSISGIASSASQSHALSPTLAGRIALLRIDRDKLAIAIHHARQDRKSTHLHSSH